MNRLVYSWGLVLWEYYFNTFNTGLYPTNMLNTGLYLNRNWCIPWPDTTTFIHELIQYNRVNVNIDKTLSIDFVSKWYKNIYVCIQIPGELRGLSSLTHSKAWWNDIMIHVSQMFSPTKRSQGNNIITRK